MGDGDRMRRVLKDAPGGGAEEAFGDSGAAAPSDGQQLEAQVFSGGQDAFDSVPPGRGRG